MPPLIVPTRRRLWMPGDPPPFAPAPRRRVPRERRTLRDWMRSPFHAMGRAFSPSGWTFNADGGLFGATSSVECCRYAVRKCSDNSLAGEYVQKSDFPSFPSTFYFWDGSQCVYVQASDTAACDATPLASIGTIVTGCSDSACGSLCEGRHCGSGALGGVYAPCPGTGVTAHYRDTATGYCYTVVSTDPAPTGSTATPTLSAIASCSDTGCLCPTCPGTLPTSVTVSGLDNLGTNCGGSAFTETNCHQSCTESFPLKATWNGVMTGPSCDAGPPPDIGYTPNLTFTQVLHFSDGTCWEVGNASLKCLAINSDNNPGWQFGINAGMGAFCAGSGTNFSAIYIKGVGTGPLGTYTLYSLTTGNCFGDGGVSLPGTITIS